MQHFIGKKNLSEKKDSYYVLANESCYVMLSLGNKLYSCTGGIIWEVEGRGSGSSSKGVAYHTDSPTQVEEVFDLGWWVCMICYPLTTTPPTFHLPNNIHLCIHAIQIHVRIQGLHPAAPGTLPRHPPPLSTYTHHSSSFWNVQMKKMAKIPAPTFTTHTHWRGKQRGKELGKPTLNISIPCFSLGIHIVTSLTPPPPPPPLLKWPNPTCSQDYPHVIIKGHKIWPIWPTHPQKSPATGLKYLSFNNCWRTMREVFMNNTQLVWKKKEINSHTISSRTCMYSYPTIPWWLQIGTLIFLELSMDRYLCIGVYGLTTFWVETINDAPLSLFFIYFYFCRSVIYLCLHIYDS